MALTIPALYEAVYGALTSPLIIYTINNSDGTYGTATLPKANVVSRSVWLQGATPPNPLIAFAVGGKGSISRLLSDRNLRVRVWVVADAEITARYLYEAVRARLHTADGGINSTGNLSRAASSTARPLTVRECVETEALPAEYDASTSRWYIPAVFAVTAI